MTLNNGKQAFQLNMGKISEKTLQQEYRQVANNHEKMLTITPH